MKISLKHIVIGIGLIALMTFLYFKTNVIDSASHNQFSNDLRHLKELDATLDKNILESRFGLQNSYDLLMTETEEIHRLQDKLTNVPAFTSENEKSEIYNLLGRYNNLQNQKNRLIERFKSRNAIINNSLRYFPISTSNSINKLSENNSSHIEIHQLNNMLRDTLIYYLLSDKKLELEINNQIAELRNFISKNPSSENTKSIEISISHAQTILRLKPEIDALVRETVDLPTEGQIEELIKLYDSIYNESLSQANFYRLFLYIFSILLIAYIAFIIVKLKNATTALNAVNENLEQRVQERTEDLLWSNYDLKKSEEINFALLHAIPDAMWRIDNNGVFLDLIPAKGEEDIMPKANWFGKTIFEILPTEIAEKTIELAKKSLTSGESQLFEYQLERNDQVYHYESRIAVCGESEILTIVRDISERKLLEEQLQRAQKLESIGQLAAGIAHEINTPTQYVGDNTRFLKDSFEDLSEVLRKNEDLLNDCREKGFESEIIAQLEAAIEFADTEYLLEEIPKSIEQALTGIGRIAKIVQSMKDFAHPGSFDKIATDLNRAIESTITVASNEWKYVADMETDFDATLPNIPCLIGEFNQVILNMIVNAAHAIATVVGDGSNGKGKIKISTRHKDDWIEIAVSDTGTGIKEEIKNKIFDPFFTTKEVGQGTGQGLAISHSVITEKHKGKIVVESELGKGTKFIISLPIKEF